VGAGLGELRDRGRSAYRRREWARAVELLIAVDRESPLEPADLDLLATAARLVGQEALADDLAARAYRECTREEPLRAARHAFWLAIHLLLRGEPTRSGAWLARARRLVDDAGHDCPEQGYLLVPVAVQRLEEGDAQAARALSEQVAATGARFDDPDLLALGRLGTGQALIAEGRAEEALALLDEAMVAVTADELSPVVAGIVYCAVIEACGEVFDLRRAQEWTAALTHWCAAQPDLAPFRGQCMVHRSEIMLLRGAWPDALEELRRACVRLAGHPAAGAAFYQLAELHRLRGEFSRAEEAYRQASRWIPDPQPGLALLRMEQGNVGTAAALLRRALAVARGPVPRARLLAAGVEVEIAAGDLAAARADAGELRAIGDIFGGPWLQALALHATGAALVADGDAAEGLAVLRRAWRVWQDLDAPYEAARVRVLMGHACERLRDRDSADLEFDAARVVFEHLGAAPAAARVRSRGGVGALTAREEQVLRLVASGMTNRAIAAELFLSEKTVARHLSNIFTKLGVGSRAAATAYAYEHHLVGPVGRTTHDAE
jgi:DNA-binding CsgD family transcriptional regulator